MTSFFRLFFICIAALIVVTAEALLFYYLIVSLWPSFPGWLKLIGYTLMATILTGSPIITSLKLMKVRNHGLSLKEKQ